MEAPSWAVLGDERGVPRLDHVNLAAPPRDSGQRVRASASPRTSPPSSSWCTSWPSTSARPTTCPLTDEQLHAALLRPVTRAVRARRRGRWTGAEVVGLRAVVPELLDLARRARHLPRRPLRAPAHRGHRLRPARCSPRLAQVCAERGYARLELAGARLEQPATAASTAGSAPSRRTRWTRVRLDRRARSRPRPLTRLRSADRPRRRSPYRLRAKSRPIDHALDRSLISSMNAATTTTPATIPSSSWRDGPISE